ncbi:TPA: hypothetical protein QB236_001335, partial [Pasteurella multocida]|nr:hypothetical protein [Pasteurella multocida]
FNTIIQQLNTSLGQAQTNAASIETIYKNIVPIESKIQTVILELQENQNEYDKEKGKIDNLLEVLKTSEKNFNDYLEGLKEQEREIFNNLKIRETTLESQKNKIEDILGSANMASMAKSFLERKKELDAPIKRTEFWLNIALIGMSIGVLILLIIEWTSANGFDYLRFTSRLPMILPLVWLAWNKSQRNNHLTLIQEEYAYKSAVAMAFEGYQRKVDESENESLKNRLLELSVENMGANPVRLFDKQVKSSPFEESIWGKIFGKKTKESE